MSAGSPEPKRPKTDSPITHHTPLALPGTSWKPSGISSGTSGYQYTGSRLSQQNHTEQPTPPEERPTASGSGTTNLPTDFNAINDAVGISGVDIAAEEELARQQRRAVLQPAWGAPRDRVKVMDFLDKQALTSMVQQIAASYQLKTLEPAILDVLAQAAEARLHTIIIDSIAAKEHRLASSHLRPPPLYPLPSPPPKGKRKAEGEAMYDQTVYDEPERILSILARVEGEEERRARTERERGGSIEPPPASDVIVPVVPDPPEKKKEKKRKREGPGQQAKNMSEDARARQSNQTAMRSVGGRAKYSWLSGGIPATASPAATIPRPSIIASLPAPKFAPRPSTSGNEITLPSKQIDDNRVHQGRKEGRLGGLLPAAHAAVSEPTAVGIRDSLFALERERGTGAGRGSGSRVLFKTYVRRGGRE
ncbi:hypothetical protein CROQUDRAFT_94308 [Cronartium quercuum f. sp. fusiforme G11]|uniref:Transcription initiation factor TFIID subunit 4 n=1 Tax=Cronartium quercuum f. sp. fusiforme G11 TaxID=708437 RepID=A0A9P6NJ49_9BASI|nr:hypothetical protein CROQUDRAFT_94308 [Cronartium quercuum f. sp. fusiforme G11]